MHLATRSFCGKILVQSHKVALAMLEASQGMTPVLEVLMQDYSTLPLFSLQPETKEIPITKGKIAIVDAADYEWLMQWSWYAHTNGRQWYAARNPSTPPRSQVRMHRVIMNAPVGVLIDHIDGNGLNNCKSNLRFCTQKENTRYRDKPINNTTGYKGVLLKKNCARWEARIVVDQRGIYLGLFTSPEEAARAYDAAASLYFGEFAYLNFPTEITR